VTNGTSKIASGLGWGAVTIGAVLAAVLLSLPSLNMGFFVDDYFFIAWVEDWYEIPLPQLNLYTSFFEVPHIPFWRSPGAELVDFWRPLASTVFRINHALFGQNPFPYHVHMLLWLAALVTICGRLYRWLPPSVGMVALALYAFDEGHTYTSGIICNNHGVIAAIPTLLGLVAYLRWRKDGWRPGLWLSLLGFAIGLTASEAALSMLAYPLAYELVGAPGPLRERLRAACAPALLAVVYLVSYKAAGFGNISAGYYLNPFGDPWTFMVNAVQRAPILLANLLGAIPIRFHVIPPPVLMGAGLLLVTFFCIALWLSRKQGESGERREVLWWLTGALLTLVPAVMPPPSERQLLIPAIGFAPLLGYFIVMAWRAARLQDLAWWRRGFATVALLLLAVPHFGGTAWNRVERQLGLVEYSELLVKLSADIAAIREEPAPCTGPGCDDVVFVVSDPPTFTWVPLHYEMIRGRTGNWYPLSSSLLEIRWTRTGPRSLVLEPIDGHFYTHLYETVFLNPGETIKAGDEFQADLFTAEILEEDEVGVTKIGFNFIRDLEGPGLTFIIPRGESLERVEPPAIGESAVIQQSLKIPQLF
jgi:hypothetical protein